MKIEIDRTLNVDENEVRQAFMPAIIHKTTLEAVLDAAMSQPFWKRIFKPKTWLAVALIQVRVATIKQCAKLVERERQKMIEEFVKRVRTERDGGIHVSTEDVERAGSHMNDAAKKIRQLLPPDHKDYKVKVKGGDL